MSYIISTERKWENKVFDPNDSLEQQLIDMLVGSGSLTGSWPEAICQNVCSAFNGESPQRWSVTYETFIIDEQPFQRYKIIITKL